MPLLATCIGVILACSSDAHVGCSPTLTCSLRPERFAPPLAPDAGAQTCDLSLRRCPATQVSAGGRHTCVVTDADNALCWGDDSQAQRGPTLDTSATAHGTSFSEGFRGDAGAYLATVSRVLDSVQQVSAGGAHTCALLFDGRVKCWGQNTAGQVTGSSDPEIIDTPVDTGVSSATQIDAGASHTCAIVPAGVACWGSQRYGQSGSAQSDEPLVPTLVPDTQGAVEVTCGVRHTCARLRTQEVVCWGELVDSAGAPYVSVVPTHVPELHALGISAGAGHTCALAENYSVVCWGNNDSGQLGDGTFQASATLVAVLELAAGVGQVAAGGGELDGRLVGHSCAIDKSSQVACWGRGAEGQLGSGVGADAANSQVVLLARVFDSSDQPTLGSIVRVDLGAFHSCALASQGALYCWGDDTFDQLGSNLGFRDGDSEESRTVVPGRAVRVGRFGSAR